MDVDSIINSVGRSRRQAKSISASQELKKWWIAERQSPILLEHQADLLETLISEVRRLRDYIEETSLMLLDDSVGNVSGDVKLELLIVETELERVKYIARAYIRTRMAKIDNYPYFYLEQQQDGEGGEDNEKQKLMSKEEWIYCHRHTELKALHYGLSFLDALPPDLQDLTDVDGNVPMVEKPDLDQPVFIKVKRMPPNDGIIEVAGEPVQLEIDSIYILKYSDISDLLDYVDIL